MSSGLFRGTQGTRLIQPTFANKSFSFKELDSWRRKTGKGPFPALLPSALIYPPTARE